MLTTVIDSVLYTHTDTDTQSVCFLMQPGTSGTLSESGHFANKELQQRQKLRKSGAARIQSKHIVHINVTTCVQPSNDSPIPHSRPPWILRSCGWHIKVFIVPSLGDKTCMANYTFPDSRAPFPRSDPESWRKVSSGMFIWHIDCHHFNELASKNYVDKSHTQAGTQKTATVKKLKRSWVGILPRKQIMAYAYMWFTL